MTNCYISNMEIVDFVTTNEKDKRMTSSASLAPTPNNSAFITRLQKTFIVPDLWDETETTKSNFHCRIIPVDCWNVSLAQKTFFVPRLLIFKL